MKGEDKSQAQVGLKQCPETGVVTVQYAHTQLGTLWASVACGLR